MSKEIKTNAMRQLENLNIDYELLDYDLEGDFKSATDIAEHIHTDPAFIYKTLATISDKNDIFIFLIAGHKSLDFKKASKAVGVKKLQMLSKDDLKTKIGYQRGATTSLAMKKDYPVIVDQSALDMDYISISAGEVGYGLKINPKDLTKANGAKFYDVVQWQLV